MPPGMIKTLVDAERFLMAFEEDPVVRQFLLTNLVLPGHSRAAAAHHKAKFALPLDILKPAIDALEEFPYDYKAPEHPVWAGPTRVIAGRHSEYRVYEQQDAFRAFFPNFDMHVLDTGHWVQAEKPNEFLKLAIDFLKDALPEILHLTHCQPSTMAPSVADVKPVDNVENVADKIADLKLANKTDKGPSYPFYYPYYDVNEKFPPTEIFEFSDAGLLADKSKPNLLSENAKVNHLSPYLGTEISGVQLSQLSKEGLNELALYTAERKVLVDADRNRVLKYRNFEERINHTGWHSDVTYEKQTPGTTFFFILDQPELGGDTLFTSQVEAYNRVSDEFKKRLIGLRAIHSAVPQAEISAKNNGPVRREPVETEHPLVRVHPVTGEKALFINQGFTKSIVGFKKEESDALLNFLLDHIVKGADFRIRARYEPGTVVVWVRVQFGSRAWDSR
ncbi:hypothetical protein NMY22_g17188 [Coprinellus aureogranulatus]|nr:hypothetical protein NMY22_g17188 [Coprinellus aureogranulatus]